jgi:DNA-binding CsgD family transcriptional regulator
MRPDEFLALSTLFSEAPFDGARWMQALGGLAALTGSARAQMIAIGPAATIPLNLVTDLESSALAEFAALDGANPIVNWRVAAANEAMPMAIVHEPHYATAKRRITSHAYDEFCGRHDVAFGCQTRLHQGDDLSIGLVTLRTEREGPSTPETLQAFGAAAPFARLATRTALLLEHQGAQLLEGTLQSMSIAALLIDDGGVARAITPKAEAYLAGTPALRWARGSLQARSPADSGALRDALNKAMAGMPTPIIAIGKSEHPTFLTFIPLPRLEWVFGFLPRVLVVIRGQDDAGQRPDLLRALYGLTPSEIEIVRHFLAGRARSEIAELRGVSLGTMQSQMKMIFRKVGVNREAELAIRLAAIP